jgi:Zn-dependent protease
MTKNNFWYFSKQEKFDLIISWLALSAAFIWLISKRFIVIPELSLSAALSISIPTGLIAVGTGFVLHELAHRQAARHFGFHSEYRAWYPLLGLAVVFAVVSGWILAAPGATYFFGQNVSKKQNGIISAAGPIINLIVGICLLISSYFVGGFMSIILGFSATINFWFAFFNLLPIFILDGTKVIQWNKGIWAVLFVIAGFFAIGEVLLSLLV